MKFNGELKFPDIDHPGVPVVAAITDTQFELLIEGESLGRWSLFDVEANRLVASAFLLKLDGEEVTFVAADPIDFAYRGVEHMAESWAAIKARRPGARSLAIRKSRKGSIQSRVPELRSAMEANLQAQSRPGRVAGSGMMPGAKSLEDDAQSEVPDAPVPETLAPEAPIVPESTAKALEPIEISDESGDLEEERERLHELQERLQQELAAAEEREAVRVEAYRIEMERLEQERKDAHRLAELAEQKVAEAQAVIAGAVAEGSGEAEESLPTDTVTEVEPPSEDEAEVEAAEAEQVPEPDEEPEPELQPEPEDVKESVAAATVVDLNDYELGRRAGDGVEGLPVPEPAMAGQDKSSLMGAVKSAFARGGGRTHEHRFIEAPGGIGITRYVCEDCGYVSISA